MLRSYRGILVALAGLGALFWAFALGVGFGELDTQEQRYQPYRYAADQPTQIEPPATGQARPQALQYRTPCEQPKGHDESDLCAQWKAANAAEDSAFWAKWGFWIGVIGSAFLLWQIILTRRAVEDTGEATEAMREANRLARLASEMDLRAWIGISATLLDCEMDSSGFAMGLKIELENFGRTPAPQTWVSIRMYGRTGLAKDCEIIDEEFSDQPFGPIFPGARFNESFRMGFSNSQIEELTNLTAAEQSIAVVVFEITVEYSTGFDETGTVPHRSRIAYSVVCCCPDATNDMGRNWFNDRCRITDLRMDRAWVDEDEPT